jgi:hypothetical protein
MVIYEFYSQPSDYEGYSARTILLRHVTVPLALSEVAPFLQLRKASFSVHEVEDHILPPSPDKEESTVCG